MAEDASGTILIDEPSENSITVITYHSWEKGANENTNGLIRQYIPKGTDFSTLTGEFIAEVEWKLNNRPRKSLGYLTPLEYFKKMFNFTPDSAVALSN